MISCICASQGELALPVHCFWQQTFSDLELIVVHSKPEWPKLDALVEADPNIRSVLVKDPKARVGARYNAGVKAASGEYIAIWDSDDWHAPSRLRAQYESMREQQAVASALLRIHIYDKLTHRAVRTHNRLWEGTLLVDKEICGRYNEEIEIGADTELLWRIGSNMISTLDDPEQYLYVLHESNMCGREHGEMLLNNANETDRQDEFLENLKDAEERFCHTDALS